MNCFELLKTVLDDAYLEIKGSEEEKDERISAELSRLSSQYRDLTKQSIIDYSDPVTRFAYAYSYVTSHANLVCDRIRNSTHLKTLFERDTIQVSCIGGGPGSDLLGILKYLHKRTSKLQLTCNVFDRETAWGETWAGLFQKVDSGVKVLPSFNVFNVIDPTSWQKFRRYLNSDLFTMVYFMSEVYGLKTQANDYFSHLLAEARQGATFIYIDNRHSEFTNWFDTLAKKHGLDTLDKSEGTYILPRAEEKKTLEPYYSKFRDPKIKANITWRIAQKR